MTSRTVLVSMTMPPALLLSRVLGVVSPPWNDASAPIDDPRFTAASADSGTGSRKNRAEGTGSADWTLFPVPLHLLRPIDGRLKRRREIQRRHHRLFPFFFICIFIIISIRSRECWFGSRKRSSVIGIYDALEKSWFEKGLDSIIRGERITKAWNCETGDIVLWNGKRERWSSWV